MREDGQTLMIPFNNLINPVRQARVKGIYAYDPGKQSFEPQPRPAPLTNMPHLLFLQWDIFFHQPSKDVLTMKSGSPLVSGI